MKNVVALFLLLVCCLFFPSTPAKASSLDAQVATQIYDNLFQNNYDKTTDGSRAYYQIDVTTGKEETGGIAGAFETVGSWLTGDAIKDTINANFYEAMNFFVNIVFKVNVFYTKAMLAILEYAFRFEGINNIIDRLESTMQGITGISGGTFGSSGLFGPFLPFISVLTAVVFLFQFFFRRAQMQAAGTVFKTIGILLIALIFFTNYGTILKGMNNLTTQLTTKVMNASSGLTGRDSTDKSISVGMWNMFVHRPYLYLQYGSDNEKNIGQDRVENLLKLPPGKTRQTYVTDKEVRDRKNTMMTYGNVPDRVVFTQMYSIINFVCAIPILLLAMLIVLFQFWFLAMTFVAPFYILIAAFPGNSAIFRRYIEELVLPLLLKSAVAVLALVVFTISDLIYEVSLSNTVGYFATAYLQIIIFALLFLLRKRFMRILFAGGNMVRNVAQEVSNFDQRLGAPVRTITRAALAGAGFAVGGAVGAAAVNQVTGAFTGSETNQPPLQNVPMQGSAGGTGAGATASPTGGGLSDEQMDEMAARWAEEEPIVYGTDDGREGAHTGGRSNTDSSRWSDAPASSAGTGFRPAGGRSGGQTTSSTSVPNVGYTTPSNTDLNIDMGRAAIDATLNNPGPVSGDGASTPDPFRTVSVEHYKVDAVRGAPIHDTTDIEVVDAEVLPMESNRPVDRNSKKDIQDAEFWEDDGGGDK